MNRSKTQKVSTLAIDIEKCRNCNDIRRIPKAACEPGKEA